MALSKLEHEMVGFRSRAGTLLLDDGATRDLLHQAWEAAAPYPKLQQSLAPLGRLVRAHLEGTYPGGDPDAVAWALAAILYVASPWDLEPDYLPNGLRDDLLATSWVHDQIEEDVHAFREWEQSAGRRHR